MVSSQRYNKSYIFPWCLQRDIINLIYFLGVFTETLYNLIYFLGVFTETLYNLKYISLVSSQRHYQSYIYFLGVFTEK